MAGINFKNYAVMGIPTLYLLDQKGIILKKSAMADEFKVLISQSVVKRLLAGLSVFNTPSI